MSQKFQYIEVQRVFKRYISSTATRAARTPKKDAKDPTKDIIMVATGTGIAPFRSFLHRLYMEHTIARQQFQGQSWLILGVPTTGSLLYKPEFDAMQQTPQGKSSLTIDYAISREMTNAQGGKLYVQDVLSQKSEELFSKLESGAVIYFCGALLLLYQCCIVLYGVIYLTQIILK